MMGKRNNVIRNLAGKTWGCSSKDLCSVHVTYNQPAGEYAIGAWGPFVSKSNMQKLETKQNEAARIITGCCHDTRAEVLLAEAGLTPITLHSEPEATLLHERNLRLLEETPARMVAEHKLTRKRLREKGPDGNVILPPRETAKRVMKEISLENTTREPALTYSSI